MGRPRKYDSEEERRKADAERKRVARDADAPRPVTEKVTAMNEEAYSQTTEAMEQAIRDKYGYAASETRTAAERQAAADRMLSKKPTADLGAAYKAGYDKEPCPDPDNTPVAQAWTAGMMDRRSGFPAQAVYRPLPESAPQSRAQAAAVGRRFGAHEADRRGEHGAKRETRIRNAETYAIWVYEGKPSRSDEAPSA